MPANTDIHLPTSASDPLELQLSCHFCGGEALLRGRWHAAIVFCTACGMEAPAASYQEQIEQWQEKACHWLADKKDP